MVRVRFSKVCLFYVRSTHTSMSRRSLGCDGRHPLPRKVLTARLGGEAAGADTAGSTSSSLSAAAAANRTRNRYVANGVSPCTSSSPLDSSSLFSGLTSNQSDSPDAAAASPWLFWRMSEDPLGRFGGGTQERITSVDPRDLGSSLRGETMIRRVWRGWGDSNNEERVQSSLPPSCLPWRLRRGHCVRGSCPAVAAVAALFRALRCRRDLRGRHE